jgi:hypothetical protein
VRLLLTNTTFGGRGAGIVGVATRDNSIHRPISVKNIHNCSIAWRALAQRSLLDIVIAT